MRFVLLALAATAFTSTASAAAHHRRHNHAEIFKRHKSADACSCKTYVTSYLIPVTIYPEDDATTTVYEHLPTKTGSEILPTMTGYEPLPTEKGTTTVYHTNTHTSTSVAYVTTECTVPAPLTSLVEKPGTYTFPAHTLTLTETATGHYPETTALEPGTHTYGGITTIVETSTVVTCPYVTTETKDGTTTEKVYETKYECPTGGTFTIGASTTVVPPPKTVTVTYAVPTVYLPGTYVQPELTTTITETSVVVTCPFTKYDVPKPTTTSVHEHKPETTAVYEHKPETTAVYEHKPETAAVYDHKPEPTTAVYDPKPESTTLVYVPKPQPTTTTTSVYHKPTSVYTPSSSSTSVTPPNYTSAPLNGKHWAITYSPYTDAGQCKSASEVASDIADIAAKGFQHVRIYSTDCNGLSTVGTACRAHGVGIIAGIFIKAGGVQTGDQQLADLKAWKSWDLVHHLIVGNEAIFNNYCTGSELAAYINHVRSELSSVFSGPVYTTEPLNILQANGGSLCSAMDYVGINVQAFFDGGVTGSTAGTFLKGQLQLARDVCGGKEGYVLEAGWPSSGNPNGKAMPSPEEQLKAVSSFEAAAPGHVSYFTYTNDLWKVPGYFGVEQHFGCAELFA